MVAINIYHLIVVILLSVAQVNSIIDYCTKNNFDSYVQSKFTKEPISKEYAVRKQFKGLHCCAKEYSSIEWFKNNKPYPWSAQVSKFILYPESGNQTIYSSSVVYQDAGNYTCVVNNNNRITKHSVQLIVLEKLPTIPQMTHAPTDVDVFEGQPTRFFCEAFIGLIILPDARSDIQWLKFNENSNKMNVINFTDQIRQQIVSRENNQILGSYLIFNKVTVNDYGSYTCRISNIERHIDVHFELGQKGYVKLPVVGRIKWVRLIMWPSLVVIFCVISCIFIHSRFGLLIRIFIKDFSSRFTREDTNNDFDVIFCFFTTNTNWLYTKLMPILHKSYSCRFAYFSILADKWSQNLLNHADKCKMICLILSEESISTDWQIQDYQAIVRSFKKWNKPILIITTTYLPNLVKSYQPVTVLHYDPDDLYSFYLKLHLSLPPKRTFNLTNF